MAIGTVLYPPLPRGADRSLADARQLGVGTHVLPLVRLRRNDEPGRRVTVEAAGMTVLEKNGARSSEFRRHRLRRPSGLGTNVRFAAPCGARHLVHRRVISYTGATATTGG